jgi:dienelactone hydrolase
MSLQTQLVDYLDGDIKLQGYCAFESGAELKPAVLICHDWAGRSEFACQKAEYIASLGYVGFAVDMYGDARVGKNKDENASLMMPLLNDRKKLRERILAALNAVKHLKCVDSSKITVMGFCFGGLCALDLARSGADIKAAISLHGNLSPLDGGLTNSAIQAKLLVLHGHDDPLVSAESVTHFQIEMTQAKADWQLHVFSNCLHAFTNPEANDAAFGTVYNPLASKRSFEMIEHFLADIFK